MGGPSTVAEKDTQATKRGHIKALNRTRGVKKWGGKVKTGAARETSVGGQKIGDGYEASVKIKRLQTGAWLWIAPWKGRRYRAIRGRSYTVVAAF